MIWLDFFKTTPSTYLLVVGVAQALLLLLFCFICRVTITWIEVAVSLIGCAAIGTVAYFFPHLQLGAFLLFFAMSFGLTMILSKGEPLISLGGAFLSLCLLYAASIFLVQPYYPLTRAEIGGATLFMHEYQSYELPSEIPFLDTH